MRNLLSFLILTIFNQRGEIGEEAETSYFSEEDFSESDANQDGADGEKDSNSDGQSEGNPDDGKELSIEDQLNAFEVEKVEVDKDAPDLLSMVNGMDGLLRNGLPIEYSDIDAIKKDLMQGHDYTQKTQALAEERKQFEQELVTGREEFEASKKDFETEKANLQEDVLHNDVFGQVMEDLKVSDPDIYEEIALKFQSILRSSNSAVNSPQFTRLQSDFNELKNSIGSDKQSDTDKRNEGIRSQWDEGLKETQTKWGPKLKSMGLKADWAKVQKIYAADKDGVTTVNQAFITVHGEEVIKLMSATGKTAKIRADSARRIGGTGADDQKVEKKEIVPGNYLQSMMETARKLAG